MPNPRTASRKVPVIVAVFDAQGGPEKAYQSPRDPHPREPTPNGKFVVAYCERKAGSDYGYGLSKIPWGSKLRLDPKTRELEVQINGQWRYVKEITGYDRESLESVFSKYYKHANTLLRNAGRKDQLNQNSPFPEEWIFNDFGHMSCYYFKDVNGNRRQDSGEKMSQEVFHSTPEDEFATAMGFGSLIQLSQSHGCIHVKPKDIDVMIGRGYLKTGNAVIVHGYADVLNPTRLIGNPHALGPYELHFYPASKKLVVYGVKPK